MMGPNPQTGGASDGHPAHLFSWGPGEKGWGGVTVHVVSVSCVRLCRVHMYIISEPRPKFWQMTERRSKWVSLESP
jgi:hypothetical protein